jgi:hypothetical protein
MLRSLVGRRRSPGRARRCERLGDLTSSRFGRLVRIERSGTMCRAVSEPPRRHVRQVRAAWHALDAARSRLDQVTVAEDAKVSLACEVLAASTRRLMRVTARPDEIPGLSIRVLRQMAGGTYRI